MLVSATELRTHVYKLIDHVLTTGEPIEIKRHGQMVKIIRETKKSRLSALEPHPDIINCNEEELLYPNWLESWNHDLP